MPITKTSEKTVEVNVLHDLATCLERRGFRVTIVAPTQREERRFGFDDIFDDLPSGHIIALQFKRPEVASATHAKFKIDFDQLRVLRHNFVNRDEAFYVFCPYPTIAEFRRMRQDLLNQTTIVDIRTDNIPLIVNFNLKTVKVNKTNPLDIRFTRRRDYVIPRQVEVASNLCHNFFTRYFGRSNKPHNENLDDKNHDKDSEIINNKKIKYNLKGTYLVHISKIRSRSRR